MKLANINIDMDCGVNDALNSHNEFFFDIRLALKTYRKCIPRFLNCLDKFHCKATFFVVGCTAEHDEIKKILREIYNAGHEIASHTWTHSKQFNSLPQEKIDEELYRSKAYLEDIIGTEVIGFRSPGYAYNEKVIKGLMKAAYRYTSSINLSIIYYLGKWAYKSIKFKGRGKDRYYLNPKLLIAPRKPYFPDPEKYWHEGKQRQLLEIPISADNFRLFPATTWSIMIMLPKVLRSLYWNSVGYSNNLYNVEFHDFEFYDIDDFVDKIPITNTANMLLKLPLESRIIEAEYILEKLSHRAKFILMKDISKEYLNNIKDHETRYNCFNK